VLFLDFYEYVMTTTLDPRLKDVVRQRVGELAALMSRYELPRSAAELEPPTGLAPDEHALVRFVDAFAVDHHAIPEEILTELREHFSYPELTEVLWTLAAIRAMARVGAVIGTPAVA
jgi:alkylhydroperoxidase family enzyme